MSREAGFEVESRCAEWLEGQGARVLARNFGFKAGEIDLVLEEATTGGGVELVFVEVRSRRAGSWVPGLESVDCQKRRKIQRAARYYLAQYRGAATSVRFDVVDWDGRRWLRVRDAWQV